MALQPLLKHPARYFALVDPVYRTAWEEDEAARKAMVTATARFARRIGAVNYRFIRSPQGGYAPGVFVFSVPPCPITWEPVDGQSGFTPRKDTAPGVRMLDLISELPSCLFMKVLSVAGIDNVANIALPPNQVLEMQGVLYLVWYAPKEVAAPFGTGAVELEHHEFQIKYADHLARLQ